MVNLWQGITPPTPLCSWYPNSNALVLGSCCYNTCRLLDHPFLCINWLLAVVLSINPSQVPSPPLPPPPPPPFTPSQKGAIIILSFLFQLFIFLFELQPPLTPSHPWVGYHIGHSLHRGILHRTWPLTPCGWGTACGWDATGHSLHLPRTSPPVGGMPHRAQPPPTPSPPVGGMPHRAQPPPTPSPPVGGMPHRAQPPPTPSPPVGGMPHRAQPPPTPSPPVGGMPHRAQPPPTPSPPVNGMPHRAQPPPTPSLSWVGCHCCGFSCSLINPDLIFNR